MSFVKRARRCGLEETLRALTTLDLGCKAAVIPILGRNTGPH